MPKPVYKTTSTANDQAESPVPGERNGRVGKPKGNRGNRGKGSFKGCKALTDLVEFLTEYIVLPERSIVVVSAWVFAAHLMDIWDRFPHIAIKSPDKRCGKTRFLQMLEEVTPNPVGTTNISPAAMYRLIKKDQPTILLDEAQSMRRRGSEFAEIMRELFCASIDRDAKVIRCGGNDMDEIVKFSVYSPKVIAMIGEPDSVLADRCLPIEMKRKTKDDIVKPYRSRVVKVRGKEVHKAIEKWAELHHDKIEDVYDKIDTFPIDNDRIAELLLPLQAVLQVAKVPDYLDTLEDYAQSLDDKDRADESLGVRLLAACREIIGSKTFLPTKELLTELVKRTEEPWARYNKGEPITADALAILLRPYKVKPDAHCKKRKGKVTNTRGYYLIEFEDAWARYL